MANNQYVNKVVFGGATLIDLTGDTITPEDLAQGVTAHDASGASIVGTGGVTPTIPDGKTVTPINDVVIWQKCAGIANPTYTTLSEILADVGILKTLMASDNAVDYLARSKQFIGSDALVPVMTSDTTPNGIVSYSSQNNSTYAGYKAFDNVFGDTSVDSWMPNPDTDSWGNAYVAYEFAKPVLINRVKIYFVDRYYQQRDFTTTLKVQGYNSLSNVWEDLDDAFVVHRNTIVEHDLDGANTAKLYAKYRILLINGVSGQGVGNGHGYHVQFSLIGICQNSNAMTYIGMFDYAADTLLEDSDWREAICNSAYFESVLNVKVPTMTSDTTPSGTIVHSRTYSNYYSWYVYSNPASSTSGTNVFYSDADYEKYIGYDFGKSVKVHRIDAKYCHLAGGGTQTNSYKLQTSIDGNNYDDISNSERAVTTTNPAYNDVRWSDMQTIICNVNCNIVRSIFTNGTGGPSWAYMQIYGRERGTVQSWLKAGGITGKTYTDISEVLNDPITLAALMSNQNAVNYLVTVKKWASTICADQTVMQDIGANNYCANTLLADDTWCSAICNSTYFESVLNVKVPTMTSNTTPSGEAIGTSKIGSENDYYKPFDNNDTTTWQCAGSENTPAYSGVGYKFPSPKTIYFVKGLGKPNRSTTEKVQGSNDDFVSDIHDLTSDQSIPANSQFTFFIQNVGSYQSYRLYGQSNVSGTGNEVPTLQFYGREDV